jgi:hypothetical protein
MRSRVLSKFATALIFCLFLAVPASQAARPGDLDNDDQVNITDAILALKAVAGMDFGSLTPLSGEVNGDGRIGIEEVLYALQSAARLRNYPTLNPIGSQSVYETYTLSFSISASDPEGDDLTFSALNLPGSATFDPDTRTFSWTPSSSQIGTYQITFVVTDTQSFSDSEMVTITVNALPLFSAPDYFPLQVGNWWDYIEEGSGEVSRTIVSGTKSINGTDTFAVQYPAGDKEYYTSDPNGVTLFGVYIIDPYYTGDVLFSPPLLLLPNDTAIGSPEHVSSSSYTLFSTTVNITARTRILAMEDVATQNRVLKDCIKASVNLEYTDPDTGDTLIEETTTYWLYKNVGVVKQIDSTSSVTITASRVNGVEDTY